MKIRLLALGALLGCGAALAQTSGTFTIIVPQPSGNQTDAVARKLASVLTLDLQATVVVDNQPSASGALGVTHTLVVPADGRTLLIASQSEPVLAPILHAGFMASMASVWSTPR